ncbi:MAG: ABC transporter ATP-binding protein [Solirubrobacterales bacterium]
MHAKTSRLAAPRAAGGKSGASAISVRGLGRTFHNSGRGQDIVAFENIDFDVADGEFLTVVGPSGCGKSTLLNTLAGLQEPTTGEIRINDEVPADRTKLFGYMFQKDLLFPWRSIRQNIGLGLEVEGRSKSAAGSRANELAGRFGLAPFLDKYPAQLSGGMRQRVALMRTLACDRPMLLLDEPFGALDALTRSLMQEWLLEIWAQDRRTVVFITHDIDESVFLSDRVLVMSARPGRIQQEVAVPLVRPRTAEISASDEFAHVKAKLVESVRAEGLKAFREAEQIQEGGS